MITARFDYDKESGSISMDVKGHAGFAELGKDPVCAGASVLAMTVAQSVKFLEEEGKLRKQAHLVIRNGRTLVVAVPKEEHYFETLHTFFVGETGMQLLAASYPESVQLTPFVTSDMT